MIRRLLALSAALLALGGAPAFAQSSAQPVVPGYLTTSGCAPGITTCFVQFGPSSGPGGVVTQGTSPWVDNISQFGGSNVVTGTGIGGAGIPRFTVSSDSTVGLAAGSAIIGKVGIDQTTPGTTNGVQTLSGSTTAVTQATAANLNAQVVGNTAAGGADSGNGVKVSGVYSSTLPTLTNGQRGDLQITSKSILAIATGGNSTSGDGIAAITSTDVADTGIGALHVALDEFNGSTWERGRTTAAAAVGAGIGILSVEEAGRTYSHISTATTTAIKSGKGFLHTITVNSLGTVASTATIYDSTTGSGTVIAVLNTLTIGQASYTYDIAFTTGLTIVTTGTVAPDITVSYR